MKKELSNENKIFLCTVLTEVLQNVRKKALYSKGSEIDEIIVNVKHLKEIIEKLEVCVK